MTSRGGRWSMLWMLAGGIICCSVSVRGDIVEQSYENSKGEKSATGFVLQGSRKMKNLGKRRSTTSPVILPPLSLETLSRKAPEVVVSPEKVTTGEPKPRFGYGSDYQPGERSGNVSSPEPPEKAPAPVSVDPATSIRFLPVKRNRTYYPRIPYFGFSSNPYFYRPGTAGRYYLYSPGCYSEGFTGGTNVNVYHGGSLTFSSWNPLFDYRYYR